MVYYDCDKPTNPKVNHTRYVLYTLKDTFVCNEHITDMWLLLSSHVVYKITHHIDEQDYETTTSQESKPHYDAVSSVLSSEDNHQVSSDVNVTEDSDKADISKDHEQTFCETDTICSILPDTSSDTNIQKTPTWSTFNSLIGEPQPIWNVGIAAPLYRRSPTEWPVLLTILMQAQHINCITVGEGSRPIVTLDGDLYDRAESSGIYESATVRQILDGRHVYRCLEAHTMTLLALQSLYQKVVFEEFEVDEMETRIKQALDTFKGYTDGGTDRSSTEFKSHITTLHNILHTSGILTHMDQWNRNAKGVQRFLTNYMRQVKVLLIFTAATRSADWKLHLSTTEELLHYFHAHDQYNYGRWGLLYVADMLELQLTNPDTWSFLDKGNFVAKHSVPFTAIDPDHAIEQEHKKMKMKGGFIGITGNEQAMEKHFVIPPTLSRIVQEFKEYAGIDNKRACSLHHELKSEKSSKLVRNAAKLVGNINMQGNPFLKNDMYNLMTFAVAPNNVSKDIEYCDQHGKEALHHFVSTRMVNNTVEFWGAQKKNKFKYFKDVGVVMQTKIKDSWSISNKNARFFPDCRHSLEEGDQLVLLNACDVMHKDPQSFLDVFSVDTDVFVLLTGHYKLIPKSTTLIRRGSERLSICESYSTWAEKSRRSYWLERADIEWKFARSKLWMSYFEEGGTAPPPFNIIPTPKSLYYLINWCIRQCCIMRFRTAKKEHLKTIRRKAREVSERNIKYQTIMRNLVRRYVTAEQRKSEHAGVTEDDVNEVKQDISSFRYELIEILKNSGMNTSSASGLQGISGKKNRQKERRLMKGFNIGLVEETFSYPDISSELVKKSPMNRRPRFARLGASTKPEHKRHHRWGHIVEAAKTMKSHLARSRSEDSIGSHSSHSQVTVGDGTSNSNGSDLSIGDVEIIPDAIGPERRRLRFWKENSTSTDTPEPKVHDDNDLAACESGMLNRRFAVLALNPAKLRASMEQYQKRMEREKMCAKTQAKRTSSAPSDNQGFSVRFKRRSKKSEEIETPKLAAKNLSSVVYSPDSTPNTPSPMCPSDDVQAVTAFGDRAAEQLRNPRNEVSSPDSEVSDDKLVTSESQEPLVSNALNDQSTNKQSNGSALALARTHGIQPINRQMSAGWL
ncbi:Transient receptor potential-gamma protein [Nymphon striatum]|nr:Transient receptor potential-gamma protein [Nymphon striatum]